ncbi:hypothetical protein HX021_07380 [Sphingobacterium sp. N143]|uniref:hypothetical protein n=1 Tax=Sphingobacterium sp. N143 TaxID=2746727 RepID=UPI0025759FDB|nr:hypothetical protein [Sphingobacterium sp. N143]MDM1294116.1 hypothetical protein [Sphingobacterium sp. N143]
MKTTYEQIVDIKHIASSNGNHMPHILSMAQMEKVLPAASDKKRTLLLAIDVQNDFMESIGSLAVDGSRADVRRLTQWMYQNLEHLTQVMCSLDCHSIKQIFHASWWVDRQGNHPAPFTVIRYEDVVDGIWAVADGDPALSLNYLQNLAAEGKKQLCIWPYHCLEGTFGAQLEGQFTNMLYFHSAVRNVKPILVYKGQDPNTEMYGIIKAEYDNNKFVNHEVLQAIQEYDHVYIAGQASSHCVLASTVQILEHFSQNRTVTSRITLLIDCMSPIAGFEEDTLQQFQWLKEKYGIQIKKTTDVIL